MHRRRIAILSDQTLFREGLQELLHARGLVDVATFDRSDRLLEAVVAHAPEVLFVDLDHEREDVMALAQRVRLALPETQIVVIGSPLRRAVSEGAINGALETPAANAAALMAATAPTYQHHRRSSEAERQFRLWSAVTPRQRDVLRWLATGLDNRAVAGRLRIGERAVKAHVSALLDRSGLSNRTQLSLLADQAGLRPLHR